MQNSRLVSGLSVLWLVCYTKLVQAAALSIPFAEQVYALDYESIVWAAAFGLMGGAARTIYELASRRNIVGFIVKQGIKDAIIAAIGGLLFYAVSYVGVKFAPGVFIDEVRIIGIIGFGAWRGKWTRALEQVVEAGQDRVIRVVRGKKDDDEPPPSAVMPIENSK